MSRRRSRESSAERSDRWAARARWDYQRQHRHLAALKAVAGLDGYANGKLLSTWLYANPPSGGWSDFVTAEMLGRSAVSVLVRCRKLGLVVSEKRKGLTWFALTANGERVAAEDFEDYRARLFKLAAAKRDTTAPANEGPILRTAVPHSGRIVRDDETAGDTSPDGYVMENVAALSEADLDDTNFELGERVRANPKHEMFADEEGRVVGRGKGQGFYSGEIVYDVLIDGTVEPERFSQDELDAA